LSEEFKAQQHFLSRPKTDFKFMNAKSRTAFTASGIMTLLEPNRLYGGLYECANKFQRESAKEWKNQQKLAQLLCLPLSYGNETKFNKCSNVLLLLLEMSSIILVWGKDAKTIVLADDYNTKWQITVGDGLSQLKMRQYDDNTIDAACNRQECIISNCKSYTVQT
jgi:hypothetical protein